VLLNFPVLWHKRREIQAARKLSTKEIKDFLGAGPPPFQTFRRKMGSGV
jgi:hypothetical protein